MVSFCNESKGKLTIDLHVQPKARKTEIIGVHGETLKIKVAAPPVDGEANEEIIRFFAKFLGVPKNQIQIRVGGKSRKKVVEVSGVTTAEFTSLLIQHKLLSIQLG